MATWEIDVGNKRRIVHDAQIKAWVPPVVGQAWTLHYRGLTNDAATPADMDEWEVKKVLAHRLRKDGGGYEFLTRWKGFAPGDDTWEPAQHFMQRVILGWLDYCKMNNVDFTVMQHMQHLLHLTPTQ